MQHPDLYINKCSALKEEFICSAFGRKIQLRINYQYNIQRQLFMEKEANTTADQNSNMQYGIKTYVPSSFTGSYQYLKKYQTKDFS